MAAWRWRGEAGSLVSVWVSNRGISSGVMGCGKGDDEGVTRSGLGRGGIRVGVSWEGGRGMGKG